MNVYIIRNATGEILTVNRTIDGVSLEAFAIGITTVDGNIASKDAIAAAIQSSINAAPSVDAEDDDGTAYKIERHFVAA